MEQMTETEWEAPKVTNAHRGWRSWRGAVCAGVVACLVAGLVLGLRWRAEADSLHSDSRDRHEATETAVEAAELLLGLDARSAKETLTQLRKLATGDFAEQVGTLGDTVAGVLRQGKVDTSGQVAAAGIERITVKGAVVLVASTALVTNSELSAGELRTFRMAIRLSHLDGAWKVSTVEFLS